MKKSKKIISLILITGMISVQNPYVYASDNEPETSTENTKQEIYEEKKDERMLVSA